MKKGRWGLKRDKKILEEQVKTEEGQENIKEVQVKTERDRCGMKMDR